MLNPFHYVPTGVSFRNKSTLIAALKVKSWLVLSNSDVRISEPNLCLTHNRINVQFLLSSWQSHSSSCLLYLCYFLHLVKLDSISYIKNNWSFITFLMSDRFVMGHPQCMNDSFARKATEILFFSYKVLEIWHQI